MLTLLVVILHDLDKLPELLATWRKANVPGITMLPSLGGFQAQNIVRRSGISALLNLLDVDKAQQRTLLALIDDEKILQQAIAEADRVVKGFDRPHSGILFTLPVGQALGLQKWGRPEVEETPAEETKPEQNLLEWFREDLRQAYGKDVVAEWGDVRNVPVRQVMRASQLDLALVQMDTPLPEVLQRLLSRPQARLACVVNNEGRLMGVIAPADLAEVLMVPVVPEAFITEANGYEDALKVADPGKVILAADIMSEPVFVDADATLEAAYIAMRKGGYAGLPVVDSGYHVLGYLSMLDLLAACAAQGAGDAANDAGQD